MKLAGERKRFNNLLSTQLFILPAEELCVNLKVCILLLFFILTLKEMGPCQTIEQQDEVIYRQGKGFYIPRGNPKYADKYIGSFPTTLKMG